MQPGSLRLIPFAEQSVVPWKNGGGTTREVAAYLNLNEKTVYRLAQRRELRGFKVAGAWRFQRRDLEAWIEDRKQTGSAEEEEESDEG